MCVQIEQYRKFRESAIEMEKAALRELKEGKNKTKFLVSQKSALLLFPESQLNEFESKSQTSDENKDDYNSNDGTKYNDDLYFEEKNDTIDENDEMKIDRLELIGVTVNSNIVGSVSETSEVSDTDAPITTINTVDTLSDEKENEDEATPATWVEILYSTVVESLSTADLITDYLVLEQFVEGGHQWWASWMVVMIAAPYLVSFSVLGTLFEQRVSKFLIQFKSKELSKWSIKWILFTLICFILMTPLSIIYFIIIDVFFMIYVLFSTFLFLITFKCSCIKIDITDYADDLVFKKLLGMNRMQIIGYRRLRTLSSLLFESIPQILLQGRVLYAIERARRQGTSDELNLSGINPESLIVSVGFAFGHLCFEALMIYLDSKSCDMSFFQYGLQCLGYVKQFTWKYDVYSTQCCIFWLLQS